MKRNFMKLLFVSVFTGLLGICFGQDSAKVLFIGNSYTYYNDLPQMVTDLANSLGDFVYHDDQVQGGATFQTHVNNASTYTKINSDQWDYVVLQAQSQEPSFPDAQVDANTLAPARILVDSIYDNYLCSEALFFMTWGRENGDPQWQPISTYDGMQSRLRTGYMRITDSVQGSVAPVGIAWKRIRDNFPGIQLYVADGSHPSLEGSYLAACTFYASIFRKSPVGSTFISTLDPTLALELQTAAEFVVLDSLDQWNLRPTSEHTQAMFSYVQNGNSILFTNESTKADQYSWDFGNGQFSSDENPTMTYNSAGVYTVSLISESPCDSDTFNLNITINSVGLEDLNFSVKLLTKGNGNYEIQSPVSILSVNVYGADGRHVTTSENGHINLAPFEHGLYVMNVLTSSGMKQIKVVY